MLPAVRHQQAQSDAFFLRSADRHCRSRGYYLSTSFQNVDVLPSNIALAGAEIEIVEMEDRAMRLKKALAPVKNRYDFIFIDCPPSLGLITLNALAASDTLMVPIQCEYYALEGLSQLVATIRQVKRHFTTPPWIWKGCC